ncbi:MAG TPA: mechanosensitive ion channel domain-containing protein [Verrucomicrobiae bacterium]
MPPISYNLQDYWQSLATGLIAIMAGLWHTVLGKASDHAILGPLTTGDLLVSGSFLGLTGLSHFLAMIWLRRQAAIPGDRLETTWRHQVVAFVRQPLGWAAGLVGIYLALQPGLQCLPRDGTFGAVASALDRILALGLFTVLGWTIYGLTRILETQLPLWLGQGRNRWDHLLLPLLGRALRIFLPVIGIIFALPILGLPPEFAGITAKGTGMLLIIATALLACQAVALGEKALLARFDLKAANNLEARKVYTQVHVISKVLYVLICLFCLASLLMLFEEVRRFGASLLASAGVVGVILGFAAQKTIANLFAGFQIALTQPIRIDDVVVVEGEYGRVEEITLTYVVLQLWDERRLVVPLSYFIEKPFQNWTRISADLLGAILLWVDYSLPLVDIRQALKEIIENHPLWDRRFWNLQVTDASEQAMQIRVLVTSSDSVRNWDLRCAIRERLIEYIQVHHPGGLPHHRNWQFTAAAPPRCPGP